MTDLLKIVAIIAVLTVGCFLLYAEAVTDVEHLTQDEVAARFRAATNQFKDPTPMYRMDTGGTVILNRPQARPMFPVVPTDLIVMAWQGPEKGLMQVRVPVWFLRVKGPIVPYMLRDTNFDLQAWNINPDDLSTWGTGVVLDQYDRAGNRVLVFSE